MSKSKIFILIFILIICAAVVIVIVIQNSTATHENQFSITEEDSFSMSHFYNVNGVVGYEKKEFDKKETQQILEFLSSLKYERTLDINREDVYGIPPDLTVNKQDSEIVFLLYSKKEIEVIKEDKDGNVISDEQYKTSARQLKNMYLIIGLSDKKT